MSTLARATLARDTVSERVRNEAAAQPAKLANIQQRLPNTIGNGKDLIDRAEIKSLAWKHTFKAIGSAVACFLFVTALLAGSCLLLMAVSNPIALIFTFLAIAANSTIGFLGSIYLSERCLYHSRVASLCWDI